MIDLICAPFAWVMRMVFEFTGSYGLAVIAFAIIMKLVMLPFGIKQQKNTLKNLRWQPRVKELQTKYGADRQKYAEEFQKLQQEGYNPMGGCGSTLLSMVVILLLYQIIRMPLSYLMQMPAEMVTDIAQKIVEAGKEVFPKFADLTAEKVAANQIGMLEAMQQKPELFSSILGNIQIINTNFLGWNLAETPTAAFNWLLALPVVSGVTSYLFGAVTQKLNPLTADQAAAGSGKMMMLMMPVMSIVFGFMLPAGLTLYFIFSNILGLAQSYALNYFMNPKKELARIQAEIDAKKQAKKDKKKKKYLD